jgi:hypothetical protein
MLWDHSDVFIGQLSKYIVVYPIEAAGRSAVIDYRAISLTSVVCKQLENVLAGYLMQTWDKNDRFYEGQHGFRPGYFCDSQLMTLCQDLADSLDEGVGIKAITIDFSKVFDFVPHDRLLMKLAFSCVDSRVISWVREFLVRVGVKVTSASTERF